MRSIDHEASFYFALKYLQTDAIHGRHNSAKRELASSICKPMPSIADIIQAKRELASSICKLVPFTADIIQ
jgi:hypothetical protein